ncbi:er membrane protein complex subunit 2, partial [Fagus crenata]
MVTKTEETQLSNLETQGDNGGGGAWEYLCLVLNHGLSILNDPKKRSNLGSEEWTLYEQVAVAAMDCQNLDVAKDCIKALQKRFPESKRVGRLEGLLLEAKGSWAEAEKAYS